MNERIQPVLEFLQAVIREPSVNPTAALLMLAVAILVVLLVLMGLIIALTPRRKEVVKRVIRVIEDEPLDDARVGSGEPASAPGRSNAGAGESDVQTSGGERAPHEETPKLSGSRLSQRIMRSWLPVILVAIALAFTYGVTSMDAYCYEACHVVDEGTKATGVHSEAHCVQCHEDPSVVGVASNVADRARMVWARFSGTRVPGMVSDAYPGYGGSAVVDASSCLSCHEDVLDGAIESTAYRVRMSHIEPHDAGTQCVSCHPRSGHEVDGKHVKIPMRNCITCHDGEIAASACESCHIGDITLAGREQQIVGEAQTALGSGRHLYPAVDVQVVDCGSCHESQERCDSCHGLRMPHPKEFLDGYHAKYAAFEKKKLCWRCHAQSDCEKGCHLSFATNGHADNWKQDHASAPWDSGCGCHGRETNLDIPICVFCHDNAPVKRIDVPDAARGLLDPERQ